MTVFQEKKRQIKASILQTVQLACTPFNTLHLYIKNKNRSHAKK